MKPSPFILAILVVFLFASISAQRADKNVKIEILKAIPEDECDKKSELGDILTVHFIAKVEGGETFDSTQMRKKPYVFRLGNGDKEMIRGWDDSLTNMCVGEVRRITLPGSLGYGDHTHDSEYRIKNLQFTVELKALQEHIWWLVYFWDLVGLVVLIVIGYFGKRYIEKENDNIRWGKQD